MFQLMKASSMEKHIRLDKLSISQLDSPFRSTTSERSSESYDDTSMSRVTSLDLSSNSLVAFPHAKLFTNVKKVDISDNAMVGIASILPLSKQLTHLNVSRNKLTSLSLTPFIELRSLNLSSNQISEFPSVPVSHLTQLDLSHNLFRILPCLTSLRHLETLNLSGNDISDLSGASSLLPSSIKFMNLSSNRIDRVTSLYQLSFLSLHSLCIQSNPCIVPSEFNHHPFIYALFYESLVEVDGMSLLEEEILLGEKMLQDKICKFKREGTDKESEVREYLALHSPPINSSNHNSSFDARMAKVLEKRREHENSLRSESSFNLPSDSRSLSLHSPYSNWTRSVLKDKENIGGREEVLRSLNRTPTYRKIDDEEERVVIKSLVKEVKEAWERQPIPRPRMSRDEMMRRAVVTIQRWWRSTKQKDSIAIIMREDEKDDDSTDNNERKRMQRIMDSLIQTATVQAECTEKLEENVNRLKEKLNALESLLIPSPPSNLTIDYSRGEARLSWIPPPPVDSYEVYVDGRLEGHVSGRSSSLILSNIPLSSSIQLKAVRGGRFASVLSKSVLSD